MRIGCAFERRTSHARVRRRTSASGRFSSWRCTSHPRSQRPFLRILGIGFAVGRVRYSLQTHRPGYQGFSGMPCHNTFGSQRISKISRRPFLATAAHVKTSWSREGRFLGTFRVIRFDLPQSMTEFYRVTAQPARRTRSSFDALAPHPARRNHARERRSLWRG